MYTTSLNPLAPMDMSEKISIIIPIYNAEQFLGYCLNSVLSQTYTNWEAILINDGSTDNSLDIAEHYAETDSRFQVISIPNGGVSNARNIGLELAQGKYLHFLDSDDMLASETLERQVMAARKYQKQLVVNDLQMVDFTNPEPLGPRLTAIFLKDKPAVLSAEEFRNRRMQIIWYSALLEGLYGKLYDRELWEKLELRFPKELSLGEDFVTNLKYYQACNGAVFLQQIGHYYNNIADSNSLTHKYRADLFENKMLLIEHLHDHLHKDHTPDNAEMECFHNYVASTGLQCIEKIINLEGILTKEEKYAELEKICVHPMFAECLAHAPYIPENYRRYLQPIRSKDYALLAKQINYKPTDTRPGLVNRIIRKCMRIVRPIFGESRMGERIGRWEQEFAHHGLKHTIVTHWNARKAARNQSAAQNKNHKVVMNSDLSEQLTYMESNLSTIRNSIMEYVWISEQRMTKERYLSEINELRQKKKAIMIATAEHANIGDSAITLAEQYLLSKYFPDYFQVEISTYEFSKKEAFLHAILNPDDIIFLNGGGNMGDTYPAEEDLHCKIVEDFPNHKIVLFPQTISFSDTVSGKQVLAHSAQVYNSHRDLTFFLRGNESLEFAKKHFPNVKSYIMPDVVHTLQTNYSLARKGALLCLREDEEGWMNTAKKAAVISAAKKAIGHVSSSTNIHHEDVTRDIRGFVVREELKKFARHRIVITDRLHGMIFSAITGTPCVVISSYNHKIKEYYNAFFSDSNAIFFIGNDLEQLNPAIHAALQVEVPQYPILNKNPHAEIYNLCMNTEA